MSDSVISIGISAASDLREETLREEVFPEEARSSSAGWDPEGFAREQIRGLVRQVFFSSVTRPVRQVVISAVEQGSEVGKICRRVAAALALETPGSVAIVETDQLPSDERCSAEETEYAIRDEAMPPRPRAHRVRRNLWEVSGHPDGNALGARSFHSYLEEIRREFDYSIVGGPPAAESNAAAAMAQFADGIILVLSAQHTRRPVARKIKETLESAQVRILGVVLSDRVFPIPERIYRRL